ncbi:MAG: flavin-binding protein dodecin [Candidatus Poriferisodalaceae bacterium]|jgi:flavin-binding protein dodecin
MTVAVEGQVHKVVRVVGTSPTSWEAAAQAAVSRAAKTIQDLEAATVVEADLVVGDGQVAQYRVKLELSFQIGRSRISADGTTTLRVHRCLVIANQTLASPGLHEIIDERDATRPCEFHVLVPEPTQSTTYYGDGVSGAQVAVSSDDDRLVALAQGEERLETFRRALAHLGSRLSGEVSLLDPLTATRQIMEYATFDEIIVSTLPAGVSRWLKLDLPTRLQRAFNIPVISLIQKPATP